MNVIQKLFGRGAKVEQATERSEAELTARLREVEASITAGDPGNMLALLNEKEVLTRQLQAARLAKQAAATADYKAKQAAKSAEFRARMMPVAEQIADLVPRLQWYALEYQRLEDEAYQGVPNSGIEGTGIPFQFGRRVFDAIRDAAPDVEWDWSFVSDPAAKGELPRKKHQPVVALRFPGDGAAPPGFNGIWNVSKGRPMQPGEDAGVTFLPTGTQG